MDLFEAIERRHSYRKGYKDEPVPEADLRRIVDAAIRAPSGCNAQTTSFVVVNDPALLAEMATILGGKPMVSEAKAAIVCVVEHKDVYMGMSFSVEDCAASVENMLLAATALGYATVWLDGVLKTEGRAEKIGELLGVPTGREVRIVLPLGVPATEVSQADRLPFEERAFFNRWG